MSVEIIAINVITIVTPLVKKGAEGATKSLGKTLFGQTNVLLRRLKSALNSYKEAENTIENFELNPGRYKVCLQEILVEELRENEELANELTRLIDEMGPLIEVLKKIEKLAGKAALDIENKKRERFTVNRNNKAVKRGVHATAGKKKAA